MQNLTQLIREKGFWRGSFSAMASPCEVLMEVDDERLASNILQTISNEAFRIEQKFSRYLSNNIIFQINHAEGSTISVDEETARLIDFADNLYEMSAGLFDITSGVLRKVWNFDGSDHLPDQESINKLMAVIGWDKVSWNNPDITLLPSMQIDLGGIGKEYAVDSCIQLVREMTDHSVLINFGGDLSTTCPRKNNAYWSVGRLITRQENSIAMIKLRQGAIATSGDAYRYLLKDGIRYSHVLNPKTGWPVENAPHTVSVSAATCVEAGMLSTLAMLQGAQAEQFLQLQEVDYRVD